MEEDDPELSLLALRNMVEAQGGTAPLAEKTKLNRESLYRILPERGNPEIRSLDALLHALGFRLAVAVNRYVQIAGHLNGPCCQLRIDLAEWGDDALRPDHCAVDEPSVAE